MRQLNDTQRRILDYQEAIRSGRCDYNKIILGILDNDFRFWKYEIPTLDRQIYFTLNQFMDMLNLERDKKYHKIQFEWADVFSMAFGYTMLYGNPYDIFKHRFFLNHAVKGEKNIVEKYENRYHKYAQVSLQKLYEILRLHNDEDYFKSLQEGAKHV